MDTMASIKKINRKRRINLPIRCKNLKYRPKIQKLKRPCPAFLAKHPHSYKAGIATPAQISKEPLEQKDTDVQMNVVIPCREKY